MSALTFKYFSNTPNCDELYRTSYVVIIPLTEVDDGGCQDTTTCSEKISVTEPTSGGLAGATSRHQVETLEFAASRIR